MYNVTVMTCRCFLLTLQLVKMENPYKQPQKGCLLCNVKVDFKNIQVRDAPEALPRVCV